MYLITKAVPVKNIMAKLCSRGCVDVFVVLSYVKGGISNISTSDLRIFALARPLFIRCS